MTSFCSSRQKNKFDFKFQKETNCFIWSIPGMRAANNVGCFQYTKYLAMQNIRIQYCQKVLSDLLNHSEEVQFCVTSFFSPTNFQIPNKLRKRSKFINIEPCFYSFKFHFQKVDQVVRSRPEPPGVARSRPEPPGAYSFLNRSRVWPIKNCNPLTKLVFIFPIFNCNIYDNISAALNKLLYESVVISCLPVAFNQGQMTGTEIFSPVSDKIQVSCRKNVIYLTTLKTL